MINDKLAVTASHCLSFLNKEDVTTLIKESFAVYNSKGENTYTKAVSSFTKDGTDISFIEGDFRNFNKAPLAINSFDLKIGDEVTACGYAGGFSPPMCTGGEYRGTTYFTGIMSNYIAKGMSGGPVFNKDGKVIGVNSSKAAAINTSTFSVLFGHIKPSE